MLDEKMGKVAKGEKEQKNKKRRTKEQKKEQEKKKKRRKKRIEMSLESKVAKH